MSDDNAEKASSFERRTVLGEGNLLRVSSVVGLIIVVAGGFSSYQSLRDEIRVRYESSAAATIAATTALQLSIAETSRAVSELRYEVATRTNGVVPRASMELWIERFARMNPTVEVPPFP